MTFYSQFITRILYDLPSVIIPYQRLADKESLLFEKFFKNFNKSSIEADYFEDSPNENALVWGLSNFFPIEKESFKKLFDKFKRQLSINADANADILLEKIKLVRYFITERSQDNLHIDKLEKIRRNWKITGKYIFCDVFLFHQVFYQLL